MHLRAVVTVLLLVVDICHGHQTYRLCGRHLSEALRIICKGRGYNSPESQKGPFISHERASDVFRSIRHQKGIAHECCVQSCSYNTMEKYCMPKRSDELPTAKRLWWESHFHIAKVKDRKSRPKTGRRKGRKILRHRKCGCHRRGRHVTSTQEIKWEAGTIQPPIRTGLILLDDLDNVM